MSSTDPGLQCKKEKNVKKKKQKTKNKNEKNPGNWKF